MEFIYLYVEEWHWQWKPLLYQRSNFTPLLLLSDLDLRSLPRFFKATLTTIAVPKLEVLCSIWKSESELYSRRLRELISPVVLSSFSPVSILPKATRWTWDHCRSCAVLSSSAFFLDSLCCCFLVASLSTVLLIVIFRTVRWSTRNYLWILGTFSLSTISNKQKIPLKPERSLGTRHSGLSYLLASGVNHGGQGGTVPSKVLTGGTAVLSVLYMHTSRASDSHFGVTFRALQIWFVFVYMHTCIILTYT